MPWRILGHRPVSRRATSAQHATLCRRDRRVGEVVVVDQVVAIYGAYVLLQPKLSQVRVGEEGVCGRPSARRRLGIGAQRRWEVAAFVVLVELFSLLAYPFVDETRWAAAV